MATDVALAQDRLEIVLRDDQDDRQERKTSTILDALMVLALSGTLVSTLVSGSTKIAIGTGVSLAGYILIRIWMMQNEWHRTIIRKITFLDNGLLLSSTEKDVFLQNDEIKHVHIVESLSNTNPSKLGINIISKNEDIHNLTITFQKAIDEGSLYALLEKLKAKPYLVEGLEALNLIIQLRFPKARPSDSGALEAQIGPERLSLLFQPDYRLDQARFHPTRTQIAIWITLCLALFAFTGHITAAPIWIYPIAISFRPVILFLDKPLQLAIGSNGIGIRRKGEMVYAVPFAELQSLRFTPSKISPEKRLVKAAVVFLNGEKIEWDLKMRRLEDAETLAQVSREFKELKHGD